MRMRWGMVVAILAAGGSAVCRADTVKMFELVFSPIYQHGDTIELDGNIKIDTTTGTVLSAEAFNDFYPAFDANTITATGGARTPSGGGGGGGGSIFVVERTVGGQAYTYVNLKDLNNNSYFDLTLDTASLVDYSGGTLCGFSDCHYSINKGDHQYDAGTVTSGTTRLMSTNEPAPPPDPGPGSGSDPTPSGPTAVTPEPSSLSLLGMGLAGVAGMVKRRFA